MTNPTTQQPQLAAPTPTASPIVAIIRAVVVLVVVAVIGIIAAAVLLPNNTTLILQLLGVIVPTSAALLAYLKSTDNQAKIQAIHVDVNSRLTQLLKAKGESEHAQGVIQGSEALSARQNIDALAASRDAALVAKQAADTAREAALQVTKAAEMAAAVLAAARLAPAQAVEQVLDEKVVPIVQNEVQRVVGEHKEEGH